MYSSVYDGIVFLEGSSPSAKTIRSVKVKLDGFNAQQKSVTDVKKQLARNAKLFGGNAIMNFTYGQKSGFWASLLSWDDVRWYGEGTVAKLSQAEYDRYSAT